MKTNLIKCLNLVCNKHNLFQIIKSASLSSASKSPDNPLFSLSRALFSRSSSLAFCASAVGTSVDRFSSRPFSWL